MVLLCYNGFIRPFLVAAAHRRRGAKLETFSSYEESAQCLFQRLGKARMDRMVDISAPYNGLYRRCEGFRNCRISFLVLTLDLSVSGVEATRYKHLRRRPYQLFPQTVLISPINFVCSATFITLRPANTQIDGVKPDQSL